MAFQEVKTGATDIKNHEGEPFIGIYKGVKEITTQFGEQFIYSFYNPDENKTFKIYGFTMLNRSMEKVQEGAMCRITYTGMEKLKTKMFPKGKDTHNCKVEVDSDYMPDRDVNDIPEENTEFEPF